MKKLFFVLIAVMFYISLCFSSDSKNSQRLDGIAAVVGDSIILISELEGYLFLKINQEGLKPDSLEMKGLREKLLNELIDGKVLLVHAEKDTAIKVTNDDVEGEVNHRITMILEQNGLTMKQLEDVLQQQQNISLTKFRKELSQQIKQELLQQKVQQLYVSSDRINKSDVQLFYNEYKDSLPDAGKSILLSKIVINLKPSDVVRQKAFAKISSIKEMLNNGDDFGEIAKLHSDGFTAANGGDLGFISKGTLSELAFEEKIFSLKPGETSEPFETRLGFHIVNILERRDQQVKVREIFVKTVPPENDIKKTVALLDSIRSKCKSEKDFSEAVQKFSTDDASKNRNGLMQWQSLSSIDTKIVKSFDTLTAGNLSSVIQDNSIMTLYRIADIKESRKLNLTDDWSEIEQIASRVFTQKKLKELVMKWKKNTYIDKKL